MSDLLSALRALPRDATVVIEDHALLAHALRQRGHSVVFVGDDGPPDVPSVRTAGELNSAWSALTCRNPAAVALGTQAVRDVVMAASQRSQVNTTTSAYRARGWVENLVRNLGSLTCPLASTLEGLRGVPAFIVGAGSSLDRNHWLLPECQRRGIVIGVNAAARLPGVDVALTVESNDLRHKLGPLDHVALRAFGMTADPAVHAHGAGALIPIYAGELGSLIGSITGEPKIACSSHGGTAAISLAERWGCNPIVLVGQDFAMEDGGRVYPECLGVGEAKTRLVGRAHWEYDWPAELRALPRHNPLNEAEPALVVEGRHGGEVWSSFGLSATRVWVESAAEGMAAGTRLINASEWGAAIAGWAPMSLADVLRELPEVDYQVHAAERLQPEDVAQWIDRQIAGIEACTVATADPWVHAARLLKSLRHAPLLEPWCQAKIGEVLAERRGAPMHDNMWVESQLAERDCVRIADVVATEAPGLVALLRQTRGQLRCS